MITTLRQKSLLNYVVHLLDEFMRWKNKARIMNLCSRIVYGDSLYRTLQKTFGRLDADPISGIKGQVEMAQWLVFSGYGIEDKEFFEVGTGHKPLFPVGYFLCGAKRVVTVDLNKRLDENIFAETLSRLSENRKWLESVYSNLTSEKIFNERFCMLAKLKDDPFLFFNEAGIRYLAPADAASTVFEDDTFDYHFSNNVFEHIPLDVIHDILIEAKRILKNDGVLTYSIDLSDHFQHQDSSISKINFLRFSDKEWESIAGNQFAYCNRLRSHEYLELFKRLQFEVIRLEEEVDEASIEYLRNGLHVDKKFSSLDPEEICKVSLKIMLRRQTIADLG